MHLAFYMKHGHEWMLAVFLLSGAILFSNVVHWITFAIIKRRRKDGPFLQNTRAAKHLPAPEPSCALGFSDHLRAEHFSMAADSWRRLELRYG